MTPLGSQADLVEYVAAAPDPLVQDAALILQDLGAGVGAVVQDGTGAIVGASQTAATLLGLTRSQLLGLTSMGPRWQAVNERGLPLPGDQHPAMLALATGRSVVGALMGVLVPEDGRTVWLEVTAHPLTSPEPASPPYGVVALFSDVTGSDRGRRAFDALVQGFRLLAENASDMVFLMDEAGQCDWVSPSLEPLTGWTVAEMVRRRGFDLVHPEDLPIVAQHRALLRDGGQDQRFEARLRLQDGSFRWFSLVLRWLGAGFSGAKTVIAVRDIDDAVTARVALAASERHYRMLADNASDVILHVCSGRIAWVSPSVHGVLGWTAAELPGRHVAELVHPDDAAALRMPSVAVGGTRLSVRALAADGAVRWVDVVGKPYLDEFGRQDGVVLRLRDVSAEVAHRERLEYQARHDQLTGLKNRQELHDRLPVLAADAWARGQTVALAFCDLDRFKQLNDTLGHESGDRALREVAERVTGAVATDDLVARVGGDELVVVLNRVTGLDDALERAEAIRACVTPSAGATGLVELSLSIGVTVVGPGEDLQAAMRRADDAVYLAKKAGRNRVESVPGPGRP